MPAGAYMPDLKHLSPRSILSGPDTSWRPLQNLKASTDSPFLAKLSLCSPAHHSLVGWMPFRTSAAFKGAIAMKHHDLDTWLPMALSTGQLMLKCPPSDDKSAAMSRDSLRIPGGFQSGGVLDHCGEGIASMALTPPPALRPDCLHRIEDYAVLAMQGIFSAFDYLRLEICNRKKT